VDRALGGQSSIRLASASGSWEGFKAALEWSVELFGLTMPICAMWTLSVLLIRLLKPRLPRRRLACQPGFIAAVAAGIAIGVVVIGYGAILAGADFAPSFSSPYMVIGLGPTFGGLSVSAAWLTLLLGGRCRAEASWIDRLGRAMGALWIAEAVAWILLIAVGF
jgi:hypothetical protein